MEILTTIWNFILTNWLFCLACFLILIWTTLILILDKKYRRAMKKIILLLEHSIYQEKEYEAARNSIKRQEEIYHEAEASWKDNENSLTTTIQTWKSEYEHLLNQKLVTENKHACMAGRLKKIDQKKLAWDLAIRAFSAEPKIMLLDEYYEIIHNRLKEK